MGGHALEMCLCLYFPSAHSLYFISTQNIRVCTPDGDAFPQLNISLDQFQVKSVCSSRDAATTVAGNFPVSFLSSEVSRVNVRALTRRYEDSCLRL